MLSNRILQILNVIFPITDQNIDSCVISLNGIIKNLVYRQISWKIVNLCKNQENTNKVLNILREKNLDFELVKDRDSDTFGNNFNLAVKKAFQDAPYIFIADCSKELIKSFDMSLIAKMLQSDERVVGVTMDPPENCGFGISPYTLFNCVTQNGNRCETVLKNGYQIVHQRLFRNLDIFGELTDKCENFKDYWTTVDKLYRNCNPNENLVLIPGFLKNGNFMFLKKHDKNIELPIVTVVITTHNRTNVACAVIDSLVKNLKYPKLRWCISDDRSYTGHIDKLIDQFNSNGIKNVHLEKTNNTHYGLGASLNNGLRYAWNNSDIVLTTEDDWILQKELNLETHINIMINDKDVNCIRLASLNNASFSQSKYKDFFTVYANKTKNSVFNNQVAIRRKKVFDTIGYYKENCSSDISEQDMIDKFNYSNINGVLIPKDIKHNTLDDKSLYFIHIGISTIGHFRYKVPDRYKYIYNIENENLPFVSVIITTHNRTNISCITIRYLIQHIKYDKIKWIISDDRSEYGHIERLINEFRINGINDLIVLRTNENKYGLGASLNNALRKAWEYSPITFITEDDWCLKEDLDLKKHVSFLLKNENVCTIRFGTLFVSDTNKYWYIQKKKYNNDYDLCFTKYKDSTRFIFNNQVSLKHKRIYDLIGMYSENVSSDKSELDMSNKYNSITEYGNLDQYLVLRLNDLNYNSYDNKYFNHIGMSTVGHKYLVDEKFIEANERDRNIIHVRQYMKSNIGDSTSSLIVSFLSGSRITVHDTKDKTNKLLCATGSIIQNSKENDTIWGSGIISKDSIINLENLNVKLVRGPLTRQILIGKGIQCPQKYCDPGILIPYVLNIQKNVKKKYKYGIIPHYVDLNKVKTMDIPENSIIIDVSKNPYNIVDCISKCENIISSSLHGIIISEALGIRANWVEFSDDVKGFGFKFKDYYLGSGRTENDIKCLDFRKKIDITNLQEIKDAVFDIKSLINTFPYNIDDYLKKDIYRWFYEK